MQRHAARSAFAIITVVVARADRYYESPERQTRSDARWPAAFAADRVGGSAP